MSGKDLIAEVRRAVAGVGDRGERARRAADTRAEAVVPVHAPVGSSIAGTLDVESERVNCFTAEDRTFLEECAAALAGLWS